MGRDPDVTQGDDLLARVQQALEAIPHGATCYRTLAGLRDYQAAVWYSACDCDREQRIAQRVTEAIEAAAGAPEGRRVAVYEAKLAAIEALAASSQKRGTE